MIIVPTVGLQTKFDEVELKVAKIKETSRWIQIDVCDGLFTDRKTFELELLKKFKFNTDDVLWDIHLMVKEPINWIEKCVFVGAARIIGQVEMMSDRLEFITAVKNAGVEAGLGFDVDSNIGDVPDETDEILIMGRKAGFKKYDFDMKTLEKIEMALKFEKQIGVDGGVNLDNIDKLEIAGTTIAYSETNYLDLINDR